MKRKITPNDSAARSEPEVRVDGKAGMERLAFYAKRVLDVPKDVVIADAAKRARARKRKRRSPHAGPGAADKC